MNSEFIQNCMEVELLSKQIQLDLVKGEVHWEDDIVQFFIPVILGLTDFKWLHLIAEHNLIEEDCKIVKNYLSMVEALSGINTEQLHNTIKKQR